MLLLQTLLGFRLRSLSGKGYGDHWVMVWSPVLLQLLIPLECDLWRNPSGLGVCDRAQKGNLSAPGGLFAAGCLG